MKLTKLFFISLVFLSSKAVSSNIYECKIKETYVPGENAEINKYPSDEFIGKIIVFNKVDYTIDVNGESDLLPIQSNNSMIASSMKDKVLNTLVFLTPQDGKKAYEISYVYEFKYLSETRKGIANLSIYEFYRKE